MLELGRSTVYHANDYDHCTVRRKWFRSDARAECNDIGGAVDFELILICYMLYNITLQGILVVYVWKMEVLILV
ncbi:hypothetical protein BCR32DRAFT_282108 [Anaeromyces robustus]|uniref:Uncharacterized protein n=1 Tax=Anaeromyces robustus TaxID=1754192 RepID=A0A1Y1WZ24_9FUNG|nr:hypothetical protein BCR32DRAFT_282108 [Anaeromyces robustus]|eukprot:ORX78598.1 hypothetical protein BCR32DRAFT_282108 [Anaeromyces robustus]